MSSHDSHYQKLGIEPIEIVRKNFSYSEQRGAYLHSILKYLMRYQHKDGVKDLEKAGVYLRWLIALENKHR